MRFSLILALVVTGTAVFAQTLVVTVKNPAGFARSHETIALPIVNVSEALGKIDPARLRICREGEENSLPAQVTGTEVLFQSDFDARGTRRFVVSMSPGREVPHASLVSGLYALPRQDYAWENDRIAFRVYGPALAAEVNNGIDVWTKRVRYPIVAKWYKEAESSAPGKDSYHQDQGEGADFFAVGRSLGAGALGLWQEGRVVQPGVFATWKTLANGPVRVGFALTYKWLVDGDSLAEEMVISLDAGENLNRIEVRFSGPHAGKKLALACGLVKRANTLATRSQKDCLLSLWGPTIEDPLTGELGTAVLFPSGGCAEYGEDKDQHLIIGESRVGASFVYHAGAGWTGNGEFHTEKDWAAYLDRFALRERFPLEVTVARKQ